MKVGYARVSTPSQDIKMQIDALEKEGCRPIYQEVISGAKAARVQLEECFKFLKEGDTLIVWSIDRLGRTQKELINLLASLKEKSVSFRSLKENIETDTPMGQMMFSIFSMLAEFEHNRSIERSKAGLEAARARGKYGGRRYKHNYRERQLIKGMYESKRYTLRELCEMHKISIVTIYNYKNEE
jgi:DNA invertase Pin-like site-specific DNA recombinase